MRHYGVRIYEKQQRLTVISRAMAWFERRHPIWVVIGWNAVVIGSVLVAVMLRTLVGAYL